MDGLAPPKKFTVNDTRAAIKGGCPVCAAQEIEWFYRLDNAPVSCTAILDTPIEAAAVPTAAVDLGLCRACGFVFNTDFDQTLGEIGARYESSQASSAHFSAFARDLAHSWVEKYRLHGKRVLEVGCGHGDFLNLLAQADVNECLGLDPLGRPRDGRLGDGRVEIRAERFNARTIDLTADALVCRHTLEHIGDIDQFLRLFARWAAHDRNRVVLIEVPGSERVFEECAFWDIYYEHCSYFTESTLRYAFERAGLEVLSIKSAYDGQYLLLEARAGSPTRHIDMPPYDRRLYLQFAQHARDSIASCRRSLQRLNNGGAGVVLWQGAAKTVGLLAALGSSSDIACAVDLSPSRHDRYLPGSGLMVRAPEALRRLSPAHVVLMNPVYKSEVAAQLSALSPASQLHTINELFQNLE